MPDPDAIRRTAENSARPLKALSIMQPWAWLIVSGHKNIENRDWQPHNPGLRFRGRVLIHAGKRMDPDFADAQDWMWPEIERPRGFDLGGIVGEAEILDVVTDSLSPWFHGPYGLVIGDAKPLPFRPCRGMLGFFTPDFTPAEPKPPKPKPTPRQRGLFGGERDA